MKLLKNQTVLITRPQQQAQELADNIKSLGGKIVLFPTVVIKPPMNKTSLRHIVQQLTECDIAIFLSANAITNIRRYLPNPYPTIMTIAIGPGTKKALQSLPIQDIRLPLQFSSAGLLQMPELQNVQKKKIMIFAGENSKPFLANNLRAKGAELFQPICYLRQCPKYQPHEIHTMLSHHTINTVISTSLESLKNLLALLDTHGIKWLQQRQLIVISEKMLQYAKLQRLNKIILARNATTAAIMDALKNSNNYEKT